MVALGAALYRQGTLVACRNGVSAVLAKVPWLDVRSRADIMAECMAVARLGLLQKKTGLPRFASTNLEGVMKAWNRAYKRLWVRTKKTQVETGMKLQRSRFDPIVFYLVSSHQKPQEAHEPLQGRLLVDRYWRAVLSGDPRIPAIEKFVRAKKVRTVQWAMGAPHYLIVRPNCKHLLYPVTTSDALNLGAKAIRDKYQPKRTGVHRPITDAQRREAYRALCNAVYARLAALIGVNANAR